jgi:RNA polymerase sigma-70 factor (ECF subfamily)
VLVDELAPFPEACTIPYIPARPARQPTMEDLDAMVRAAGRGDQRAIDDLLHVLRPVVARYCRARMGGRDLSYLSADDVAQDVCMAVLKILPDYQDRGGSFLYLVRAIAANKVADAYRAVARDRSEPVPELPERPGLPGANEPESHALNLDLAGRLGKLIEWLPPHQREILQLRIVMGLSASETAEATGTSPGRVRVEQHRALVKLREMTRELDM